MSELGQAIRNRVTEMRVIPASELQGRDGNWRLHPRFQHDSLRGVLESIGIAGALTAFHSEAQGGLTLIDGHLRKEDYPDTGWPTLILDVNDAEADVLLATLDPIAALAEAESSALDALLKTVETESAAVRALLEKLAEQEGIDLGGEPVADPGAQVDKAAELQEKWQVETGNLWEIGAHRLVCGDCREPDTWKWLLAVAQVEKVNGVFTSPPYAEQRKEQYGGAPVNEYVDWWEAVQANTRASLAGDGSFFVNIKPHCEKGERVLYVFDLVLAMKRRWGWRFVDELYWKRQGYPGNFKARFKNVIEPVFHFVLRGGIKFRPLSVLGSFSPKTRRGDYKAPSQSGSGFEASTYFADGVDGARPGNLVDVSCGATAKDSGGYQAATFPVALPDFFIRAYSDEGDAWLDPFLGSGTTIVAAHQNGRRGLGIEVLPRYCAVTLERLSQMGLEPQRVE